MPINIAMDGPVGAGKSTIADCVARSLGILHLDTGAMYRAVGVTALKRGIDPADREKVTEMCRNISLDVSYESDGQHTFVDGEDVTGILRTEEASMAASKVATYPGVRAEMVEAQQRMAKSHDMLVDGRDIGTRVLADAPVKIFLTASPEVRARRRFLQLQEKGIHEDYEKVLDDLIKRDKQDMSRETDPLKKAEDAVEVDTSEMTFQESVDEILRIIREAFSGV
ncbi:MAG: (d)CMP kinase [Clostridia bacterium]|nr:(d)CMP kinase [Clostridia bacterium]MBQ9290971.1 (d)CMP kinase [Clostridia bacterium]